MEHRGVREADRRDRGDADRDARDRQREAQEVAPCRAEDERRDQDADAAPHASSRPSRSRSVRGRVRRGLRGVRGHHRGDAGVAHDRGEELEHLRAGLRVEVPGRLVGEEERRAVREGPRHRHTLHLPAGELVRIRPLATGEADVGEAPRGPRVRLVRGGAVEEHRETDVFQDGHRRQEVEHLEDRPDAAAPVRVPLPLRERRQIAPVHQHRARGGAVERPEEVQQGRLAAAGGPHQRHEGPGLDLERDPVQRVRAGEAVPLPELSRHDTGPHPGSVRIIRRPRWWRASSTSTGTAR